MSEPLDSSGRSSCGHPSDGSLSAHSQTARLLVSVRDADETLAALHGGCDVIDVKDPARGSLGCAGADAIRSVVSAAETWRPEVPVSAALGETADWLAEAPFAVPRGVTFAKLGLAGMAPQPDWRAVWTGVRSRFEIERPDPLRWVAVAYADWIAAAAPAPEDVLTAAIETRCAGFLLDTWKKEGRRLGDFLHEDALRKLIDRARRSRLLVALAGRLSLCDLPGLVPLRPDLIAVRSAVCAEGDRTNSIDAAAVRKWSDGLATSDLAEIENGNSRPIS